MGIFGIAKKGFGMLGKSMAKNRMIRGTSSRADRIKHGGRSPDIKSVKATKDIKGSVERGKSKEYLRRIHKLDAAQKKVKTGKKLMKEGQKERKGMRDTGTAFQFKNMKSWHPVQPGDKIRYKINKKGISQS